MPEEPTETRPPGVSGAFPATHWTVIVDAGDRDPEALASFCRSYWFPIYCFARRSGMTREDAEDATQTFFERLLAGDTLAQARRERGRLRNFLLRAFRNFTVEEWRKRSTAKRGGGNHPLAFDALSAEERLALEPRDAATPELEFERAWARELLRRTLHRLEREYHEAGQSSLYQALADRLTGGTDDLPYQRLATQLGKSEVALRFAAFKLRQRYRDALQQTVAETVGGADEVAEELSHLRGLFDS